jgi:hypothetical protein
MADSPRAATVSPRLPNDRSALPPASVPLRDVLGGGLVGRRVRVTGRCVKLAGKPALGEPPRGQPEWQLASDGVAVYVVGPLPSACARRGNVTLIAHVAEDSLAPIGDLPAAPRRYLVIRGGGE